MGKWTVSCHRVPDECPAAIAELITACLDHKPGQRPSCKEIVGVLSEQGRALERLRNPRAASAASPSGSKVRTLHAFCL